jgi:fructose/tagatose bisphosphate aldolase
MPIVSMRQLFDHAAENGYGLPAFMVNPAWPRYSVAQAMQ